MHSNGNIKIQCSCDNDKYVSAWESVEENKYHIMNKYFDTQINPEQKCEVFSIEGIPVASMIYHSINSYKEPNVQAF